MMCKSLLHRPHKYVSTERGDNRKIGNSQYPNIHFMMKKDTDPVSPI